MIIDKIAMTLIICATVYLVSADWASYATKKVYTENRSTIEVPKP